MNKRSISAKALVEDIKKGLSDAELMSRHELSIGQLQKIFAQLLKAGYVAQEVLDGRRQEETEASSAGFGGTDVPGMATESRSWGSPRPVPPEPHFFGPSDNESPPPGRAKPCSPSLPLSREKASRVRRNGLILILVSYAFVTIFYIAGELQARMEFAIGFVAFLGAIGWIVTAILGCLWRVRGLGQHPVWAIVAPFMGNLVVVEALSNRYEPESD